MSDQSTPAFDTLAFYTLAKIRQATGTEKVPLEDLAAAVTKIAQERDQLRNRLLTTKANAERDKARHEAKGETLKTGMAQAIALTCAVILQDPEENKHHD